MEICNKKKMLLKGIPTDVYNVILEEQLKIRKEKGFLVSLDRIVYEIIRKYSDLIADQHSGS